MRRCDAGARLRRSSTVMSCAVRSKTLRAGPASPPPDERLPSPTAGAGASGSRAAGWRSRRPGSRRPYFSTRYGLQVDAGSGWTDFGWPKLRTVGEFDGRVKYGRLLKPGGDPGDAVYAEKLREDDLRDQDLEVVRWTWPEIDHFDPVAERLRRRFDRA